MNKLLKQVLSDRKSRMKGRLKLVSQSTNFTKSANQISTVYKKDRLDTSFSSPIKEQTYTDFRER